MGHLQHLSCQGEISPGEILDHHLGAAVARGHANPQAHLPTTLATTAATTQGHAEEACAWDPHPWESVPSTRLPRFTSLVAFLDT